MLCLLEMSYETISRVITAGCLLKKVVIEWLEALSSSGELQVDEGGGTGIRVVDLIRDIS